MIRINTFSAQIPFVLKMQTTAKYFTGKKRGKVRVDFEYIRGTTIKHWYASVLPVAYFYFLFFFCQGQRDF